MILVLLLLPLAGSLLLPFLDSRYGRSLALAFSLAQLLVTAALYVKLVCCGDGSPIETHFDWIPSLGIGLHLGVDGPGLLLAGLVNLAVPFIVLSGRKDAVQENDKPIYALILLMQFALMGVFLALDAMLFYVFWELTLIPAYFILLFRGGEDRVNVTLKFFVYTLFGSLLMLIAFIYIYLKVGSFDITAFYSAALTPEEQTWIFWALFLAFGIKSAVFPLHSWQPSTYRTAPMQGTMLLSALMAKMGLFGIVRWMLPIVPEGLAEWGWLAIGLCVAGILYASVIAIRQQHLKTFFAFVSMAHLGLMAAALLSGSETGIKGALLQSVAHGIITIGLLASAEIIYRRTGSYELSALGGIRNLAPVFSTSLFIFVMAAVALPFTNGFIGEIMMLYGIFEYSWAYAAVASLTLVLGAVYMLRMFRLAMLGEPKSGAFADLNVTEKWILFPLVFLVLFFGIFYKPLLGLTEISFQPIVQLITR